MDPTSDEALTLRLSDHEDSFTERKSQGVTSEEIRKTVVAFANSVPDGMTALLFIGVNPKGEVEGVPNADKLQMRVNSICNECYPQVLFNCRALPVNDKTVVVVSIFPSAERPHFGAPAWVRRGSESVKASPELYAELIASRLGKVREILKLREQPVSVVCLGKALGDVRAEYIYWNHPNELICLVVDCNAHFVRFKIIGEDRYASEPLENVTLSRDEKADRPQLIIRQPWATGH